MIVFFVFVLLSTGSWKPFGLLQIFCRAAALGTCVKTWSGEAMGDAIYGLKIHALVAIKEYGMGRCVCWWKGNEGARYDGNLKVMGANHRQ